MQKKITCRGFTLMEILIALFIFTILSMIFVQGLRSVINAAAGTESQSAQLQSVQTALLIMSRDIEQTVNRPIIGKNGREDAAFIGENRVFSFTHQGMADPDNRMGRSSLQRVTYYWKDKHLYRVTWDVLDQAPDTKFNERDLLAGVSEVQFNYVNDEGKLERDWPSKETLKASTLPKAVYVEMTLEKWGTIKQLYVIPAQTDNKLPKQPGKAA